MDNIYSAPKTVTTNVTADNANITQTMIDNLARGRKWAKFISILTYIYVGILAIALIFIIIGAFAGMSNGIGVIQALIFAVIFGFLIFICFKIGRFLSLYNSAIRSLQETQSLEDLANSQEQFRRFTKWLAIIFTVSLVLTVLFVVLAFATGLGAMLFMNQL